MGCAADQACHRASHPSASRPGQREAHTQPSLSREPQRPHSPASPASTLVLVTETPLLVTCGWFHLSISAGKQTCAQTPAHLEGAQGRPWKLRAAGRTPARLGPAGGDACLVGISRRVASAGARGLQRGRCFHPATIPANRAPPKTLQVKAPRTGPGLCRAEDGLSITQGDA